MELDKVKELVELMKANDLQEIEIIDGQSRIRLKRGGSEAAGVGGTMPVGAQGALPMSGAGTAGGTEEAEGKEEHLEQIVSPIVGTFYAASAPDADAFVEVGSKVDEDTVVCIVEAMKVMNEIKAEIRGTIKQVLVSNGAAVEYGQALYLVEPAD